MRCTALLLLATTSIHPQVARAPREITIAGNQTCARCRIELALVATLAGPDAPSRLQSYFAMDTRGRIYVAEENPAGTIQVYSAEGHRIARIGRLGSGPGEYRAIHGLFLDAGDSLHVFDVANARHTVLAPGSYKYVRAMPWRSNVWSPNILLLPRNQVLVSDFVPVDHGRIRELRIVDSLDNTVTMFGATRPDERSSARWDHVRLVTAGSRPDRILAARNDRYFIQEWDTRGTLLASITRIAPWFPPDQDSVHYAGAAPWSRLATVWRDRGGLIWVSVSVPDLRWQETMAMQTNPGSGAKYMGPSDLNRYWDTRIEVIDPVAGTVVAAQRFDRSFIYTIGDGVLVAAMALSDADEPSWDLVRPRLIRP